MQSWFVYQEPAFRDESHENFDLSAKDLQGYHCVQS
jgi:hypothetical protein